jgi:maleylpyruvate isomerase
MITSLEDVSAAEQLVTEYVENLSDNQIAEDSLLPEWSRGHVLTHLANNARGLSNLIEWALSGVQSDMYVSMEQRGIDIETGAKRPGSEILADFLVQSKLLEQNLGRLIAGPLVTEEVVSGNGSQIHPYEILTLRERESLVHLVDLGLDYKASDWSLDFAIKTLKSVSNGKRKESIRFRLLIAGDHTWTCDQNGMVDVHGAPKDLAAWLMGRTPDNELKTSDGSLLGNPPLWL